MENQSTENQPLTKKQRRELKRQEKTAIKEQLGKKQSSNRVIRWILVVAIIAGAVFWVTKMASQNPSPDNSPTSATDAITENDWTKGGREASVKLIEYSDFQCPACGNFYPVVKKMNEEFGDKLQIAYRHFPLKQVHKNAGLAAQAAEAAGKQGKFWEMHDKIFESQKKWSSDEEVKNVFIGYAEELELDKEKFEEDLNSEEIKNFVEEDVNSGEKAKVNSTPTFFLNGSKIENPRTYDEFKNVINKAIEGNS